VSGLEPAPCSPARCTRYADTSPCARCLARDVSSRAALANEPMSTGTILRMTFSYGAYYEVAAQIVRTSGFGALYMGLAFKVAHIGGTGALNAAFIPYFKKLLGVDREIM
jgi:hypothetical protein